jgi:hypothetical protein
MSGRRKSDSIREDDGVGGCDDNDGDGDDDHDDIIIFMLIVSDKTNMY